MRTLPTILTGLALTAATACEPLPGEKPITLGDLRGDSVATQTKSLAFRERPSTIYGRVRVVETNVIYNGGTTRTESGFTCFYARQPQDNMSDSTWAPIDSIRKHTTTDSLPPHVHAPLDLRVLSMTCAELSADPLLNWEYKRWASEKIENRQIYRRFGRPDTTRVN